MVRARAPRAPRLPGVKELTPVEDVFGYWEFYRIVEQRGATEPWRVETVGYEYALDDRAGHEVFGYHWHPVGLSPVRTPHLHLGAGAGVALPALREGHLPTGLVS